MEYIGFIKDARFGPWDPMCGCSGTTVLPFWRWESVQQSLVGRSQIWEVMQYNYPHGEEHGYRFTTAFTFSVRTPKIRLSDRYWHEPIDCCVEGERYTCTVKARSVGVWRQISDMASFWIRPEYVVDYRPILDAPVNAAGEVVEEIILYCWWCILWFRISAIIAVRCWWLVVVLYCFIICGVIFFVVAHFFKPSIFWSHLWKLLKEEMHPSLFFFAFWRSTPLFVHGSCFAWKSCSVVWCCSMRFYLHF